MTYKLEATARLKATAVQAAKSPYAEYDKAKQALQSKVFKGMKPSDESDEHTAWGKSGEEVRCTLTATNKGSRLGFYLKVSLGPGAETAEIMADGNNANGLFSLIKQQVTKKVKRGTDLYEDDIVDGLRHL